MAEQIGKIEIANGYYRGGKSIGDEHWNKKSKNTVLEGDQRVFRSLSGRLVVQTQRGGKWVVKGVSTAQDIPENLRNVATRTVTNKPSGSRARKGGGTKTTQTLNSEGNWVGPQKQKLAIPQTPQEQFKQNYPNLDWYDPKNYSGTGADAEFKSEAELKVLDRSAMISNVGEYSNLPKDRTAQSMKIIENLNRAEPVQQSVAQDQETPSLNKTTTIQGNNEISEGLKIANRERKYNDPKYKLSRIQQKLVDSGFTRDELQKLRENHANWKVTRGKK